MIKTTILTILFILSSSSVTVACADTSFVSYNATSTKIGSSDFIEQVKSIENPKRFQLECNEQKIARACFAYATYLHVEPKLYKQAYDYFVTAFDLGLKESGAYIASYQINHPEIFNDNERLSIDESIYHAEQAFESDFPDATRLLMVLYTNPKFKRVDLKKSEYYNKIAIKQNVKGARYLLASLYTHEMKDKSKIDESIMLYKDDLMMEKNWQSALALMNIYLDPEKYGAKPEPNLVKTLAYAYVSSDLRDGRQEDGFNNVDTRFAEAMQTELPPETLKQAKALYLELMAKMSSQHEAK